ncbi:MAG TPA: CHAT domain-containing protein [Bryobacteraceae bacterium]|nr:CHAT domain-containing protein [Bryobacteraceae bacterium]
MSRQIAFVALIALSLGGNSAAFAQGAGVTILNRGSLTPGFDAHDRIVPGTVHRYVLGGEPASFATILIDQISVDLSVRVQSSGGRVYNVDVSSLGWESVPAPGKAIVDLAVRNPKGPGGEYELKVSEFRSGRESGLQQLEAAAAATEARNAAGSGSQESIERAITSYANLLAAWRDAENREGTLEVLLALSTLSYTKSDYTACVAYSREVAESTTELKDRDRGIALNNWANCELSLGELESGRQHMLDAAAAFQHSGSRFAVAAAHSNLGRLYYHTGHWADALREYGEALDLAHDLADRRLIGYTLAAIANVDIAMGDLGAASSFLDQALDTLGSGLDPQAWSRALANLGRVQLGFGHALEAEATIRRALEVLVKLADRDTEANARLYLGQAVAWRSAPEARQEFEKALDLYRESSDVPGESAALLNLGTLLVRQKDLAGGVPLLVQSLDIRRQMGVFDLEAESLYALARAKRTQGDLRGALSDAETAMKVVETSRFQAPGEWLRANYLARRRDVYEFAIDTCVELSRMRPAGCDVTKAFQLSERILARSLLDRIERSGRKPATPEDMREELTSAEDLVRFRSNQLLQMLGKKHDPAEESAARSRLEAAIAARRLAEGRTSNNRPENFETSAFIPPRLSDVQRKLAGKDGLVLEFSLGQDRSLMWAISSSDIHCYFLPGRDRIESLSKRLVSGLGRWRAESDGSQARQDSRTFGHLLQRPLADHPGRHKLLIIADGMLQYVPFAAIQLPAAQSGEFKFLIENYEVSAIPSAQAGMAIEARAIAHPPRVDAIAIFADAVYGRGDERSKGPGNRQGEVESLFPRLTFSQEEADQILALRPSPANRMETGFKATPENVRLASGFRYLHFSLHAYADPEHPEASGLVLSLLNAEGRLVDGVLRLNAILALPIRARLVVLSACDTAGGMEVRTEGIFGLTQAFLYAGAQQVVSSAWLVDEFSTLELMIRFYKAMWQDRLAPPAALRKAQQSLLHIQAWSGPADWAAFQVYGYAAR